MPAWRSPQQRARLPRDESERRVPTLVDAIFVLLGIHSIMRYLVLAYREGSPDLSEGRRSGARASTGARLDAFDLAAGDRLVFWALVRTPVEQRDMSRSRNMRAGPRSGASSTPQLATRRFIEGEDFTLSDIALVPMQGLVRGEGIANRRLAHLERWSRIGGPRGFAQFVAPADVGTCNC